MTDPATLTASLLSNALQNVPSSSTEEQRVARQLLRGADPFERFVPARLLLEALNAHLDQRRLPDKPVVLFMDRLGGGDGAHAAAPIIDTLGKRFRGASFIHASFATPSRGLGSLLRGNLTRSGAEHGVLVDVVSYNRPAEGLELDSRQIAAIHNECDLLITYSPSGSGGLLPYPAHPTDDSLLALSHVCVLSFPDPESSVADLPGYRTVIEAEPGLDSLLFRMQVMNDREQLEELARCTLGPDGDAEDRLWVLLDNAKRRRYCLSVEPMSGGRPAGAPIHCPCRTLLNRGLINDVSVNRIVPAGNRLLTVARGKKTLT